MMFLPQTLFVLGTVLVCAVDRPSLVGRQRPQELLLSEHEEHVHEQLVPLEHVHVEGGGDLFAPLDVDMLGEEEVDQHYTPTRPALATPDAVLASPLSPDESEKSPLPPASGTPVGPITPGRGTMARTTPGRTTTNRFNFFRDLEEYPSPPDSQEDREEGSSSSTPEETSTPEENPGGDVHPGGNIEQQRRCSSSHWSWTRLMTAAKHKLILSADEDFLDRFQEEVYSGPRPRQSTPFPAPDVHQNLFGGVPDDEQAPSLEHALSLGEGTTLLDFLPLPELRSFSQTSKTMCTDEPAESSSSSGSSEMRSFAQTSLNSRLRELQTATLPELRNSILPNLAKTFRTHVENLLSTHTTSPPFTNHTQGQIRDLQRDPAGRRLDFLVPGLVFTRTEDRWDNEIGSRGGNGGGGSTGPSRARLAEMEFARAEQAWRKIGGELSILGGDASKVFRDARFVTAIAEAYLE